MELHKDLRMVENRFFYHHYTSKNNRKLSEIPLYLNVLSTQSPNNHICRIFIIKSRQVLRALLSNYLSNIILSISNSISFIIKKNSPIDKSKRLYHYINDSTALFCINGKQFQEREQIFCENGTLFIIKRQQKNDKKKYDDDDEQKKLIKAYRCI